MCNVCTVFDLLVGAGASQDLVEQCVMIDRRRIEQSLVVWRRHGRQHSRQCLLNNRDRWRKGSHHSCRSRCLECS